MGTRNLTIVRFENKTVVAQYGQWDGYPSGQGSLILSFLLESDKVELLKQTLPKVRFQRDEDVLQQKEFLHSIGAEDGCMNFEQYEKFKKQYPLHIRDVGGDILERIIQEKEAPEIVLIDSSYFASDSLWCEWAYVVDFDQKTFEVYEGLNKKGISPEDRFFNLYDGKSDYYPIKMLVSFPLEQLPSEEAFLDTCLKKLREKLKHE